MPADKQTRNSKYTAAFERRKMQLQHQEAHGAGLMPRIEEAPGYMEHYGPREYKRPTRKQQRRYDAVVRRRRNRTSKTGRSEDLTGVR